MDLNSIACHPGYPEMVWVIVEQPKNEPYRYRYDPVSQTFSRSSVKSLGYIRGFEKGFSSSSVYGWIGGSGVPPAPHHDVILFTSQNPQVGAVLLGTICGVFLRYDHDNKFVAVDDEFRHTMAKMDISALDEDSFETLLRLYPRIGPGEGWFGAEVAYSYLRKKPMAA